ncbi:3-isopropylmalate dehydratase large subunit [Roseiflexus castenholzii]|uniref:3-isopropylmalate dehydratase large subunit n=1 Tax=Roseiflexus castenholzii TaxID=120962 RepID=UPI003C7E995E
MGQTIAEKIVSHHAGRQVMANEIAIVAIDGAMATDATAPLAIKAFREMGGVRLWDPSRVVLVIDHAAPAPNEQVGNLHALMRAFGREMGCVLYDVGEGICHQLMIEYDHVRPGQIILGADSHTPTYGALGAFAMGVGSTDLAAAWLTGKTWLKTPASIKIVLDGTLRTGVSAKDLVLFLVRQIGADGARYQAVEFTGSAIRSLSLASRMTLANMTAEMGALTAFVDLQGLDLPYRFDPIYPDPDAVYSVVYSFNVDNLLPQVAIPHAPSNVVPIDEVAGTPIQMAFIGSCTNSRLEDLRAAAAVLQGRKLAPGVRLIIAPASRQVFMMALQDGTIAALTESGATFITAGCGPCVGTHQGIPGNGENVITSTNRNFRGRMGNPHASIYLASPAVVAASALRGVITDPADVL